mmetsp:Transcript_11690/g.32383  ORF Transcript_11690/g.32383 Transcript_11690/m.32383 type:complete len:244 (-) Transcript_11690:65-796(-)
MGRDRVQVLLPHLVGAHPQVPHQAGMVLPSRRYLVAVRRKVGGENPLDVPPQRPDALSRPQVPHPPDGVQPPGHQKRSIALEPHAVHLPAVALLLQQVDPGLAVPKTPRLVVRRGRHRGPEGVEAYPRQPVRVSLEGVKQLPRGGPKLRRGVTAGSGYLQGLGVGSERGPRVQGDAGDPVAVRADAGDLLAPVQLPGLVRPAPAGRAEDPPARRHAAVRYRPVVPEFAAVLPDLLRSPGEPLP